MRASISSLAVYKKTDHIMFLSVLSKMVLPILKDNGVMVFTLSMMMVHGHDFYTAEADLYLMGREYKGVNK